jgi:hypothetical protein
VRGAVLAVLVSVALVAGPATAGSDGLVMRAVGWYQGESSVSIDGIRCQVPSVDSAIGDGAFVIGIWNTFGIDTLHFPDVNNPFANPCGGWMQLWNSMRTQGITVNKVKLRYKLGNRRRIRGLVPLRRGFPSNCRQFRGQTSFVGARLGPNDPNAPDSSNSGAPNVAFTQVIPMINSSAMTCLRDELAGLAADETDPTSDSFSDFPLIITARAFGRADNGDTFKSNTIRYTLMLRSVCGNGRVDEDEECDPTAPGVGCTTRAFCSNGQCLGNVAQACVEDADCIGTCQPRGGRSECTCVF